MHGVFFSIPIAGMLIYLPLYFNAPQGDTLTLLLFLAYCALFFSVPFALMVNKLSVRIWVDDTRLIYRSLFKKLDMQWRDIKSVCRKCLIDFGTAKGREHLEIRTTNNKTIKVVDYIMNCETMDSWEGLEEFEATVRKHTLANRPALMVTDSVSTNVTLSPVSVSDEHGDEETTTENRRQNVIFQMILLPLICLVLVHYLTKDIQKTAELVGYATLIFLPVMLVIRKMLILESQGKLTRNAYILTTVIGSIFLALIYSLLGKKDYARVSVLFILTVEVMSIGV